MNLNNHQGTLKDKVCYLESQKVDSMAAAACEVSEKRAQTWGSAFAGVRVGCPRVL